ncbi:MAG: 3-deoxy-8-phosphooctulonate synthase [Candidatus Aminicenantaceae bacterium]
MPTDVKDIRINERIRIGGKNPLVLIGGPCVIENRDHAFSMARKISAICQDLKVPYIFKASYDKANRSSLKSFRGPGLKEGLQILSDIKQELAVPVLSDIHETGHIQAAAEVLDIIQIPAFLCRQTDLIITAARTQRPLNIKKGPFMSPYEVKNIVEKVTDQGNENIILTERGTTFGYGNLVFDIRSIPIMKELGFPVVIDASHSVQYPGGEGHSSGGDACFIPFIARAGISVGCDGIFCEIHDNPSKALSDKRNSLNLNDLRIFLEGLLKLRSAVDEINSLV